MQNSRRHIRLLILAAFTAGIALRMTTSQSFAPVGFAVPDLPPGSPFKIEGQFEDKLAGLTGYELSFPGCADLIGLLPVPVETTAIPQEYRYSDAPRTVVYYYAGSIYPEPGISYRLKLLNIYNRLRTLLQPSERQRFAVYIKLWIPPACLDVTDKAADALRSMNFID